MKTIMWLCDMGVSFIDQNNRYIRQDIMEKLVDFKREGDQIAMATDGHKGFAESKEILVTSHQPNVQSPFDRLIHYSTYCTDKKEPLYWERLIAEHGQNHAFILLDDVAEIRATAKKFGVSTIDMAENRSSGDILQDIQNTRQRVATSLAA